MKTITTLLFTAFSTLVLNAPSAMADDAHHPEQPKGQTAQMAPTPAADADKSVRTMRGNVRKMQTQLDKISHTKDPRERHKLLQEHMQTMRENMMLGKGMMMGMMMDCPMMEGGMMGGGMGMMGGGMGMMGGGPASADAVTNRMNMMEKRMDMIQMMMEQMARPQAQPMPPK